MARLRGVAAAAAWLGLLSAVPASAHADPVVVAAGDVACDPASTGFNSGDGTEPPGETPGRCHMKATAALVTALAPTRVLAVGDEQNDNGTLAKFQASYDQSWGSFRSITAPVPGNHEYASSDADFNPDAPGYVQYFHDQLAPFGPQAVDPRRGWYSFDVPVPGQAGGAFHWHVVALNSECASGTAAQQYFGGACAAGSEQEHWLRSDLAADDSSCTLAFWHHPLMTTNDRSLEVKPLWDALHDDYADIVLSGHRQTYERFAPQSSDQVSQPGRGIRQFVVGTGGEILHQIVHPRAPNSEVLDNQTFGVLALTLHGPEARHPRGWYEWRFVNDGHSGSAFSDAGAADCVGPPVQAGAAAVAGAPARDAVAPVVSRVQLSRRRFRVGARATAVSAARPSVGTGTSIAYTLSEPAGVVLRIERRTVTRRGRRRVVRYRRSGVLRRSGRRGRRHVRFSGRVGRRPLKAGAYRLVVGARDPAGNRARTRTSRFTVVH
jgi:acid phosphatase type 7